MCSVPAQSALCSAFDCLGFLVGSCVFSSRPLFGSVRSVMMVTLKTNVQQLTDSRCVLRSTHQVHLEPEPVCLANEKEDCKQIMSRGFTHLMLWRYYSSHQLM